MVVKIVQKKIEKWTSLDFVKYFATQYETEYEQPYPIYYAKDCTIMKRIMSIFRKNNRGKITIRMFIGWVFTEYKKRPDFTTPLTIGFLPYWIEDYLQIKIEKKKKTKKVELSDDMKQWLEEQKQVWKQPIRGV